VCESIGAVSSSSLMPEVATAAAAVSRAGTGRAEGSAVGSPFFWQWEHPPLAVGTYTASGNSGSGNALCILFPTEGGSRTNRLAETGVTKIVLLGFESEPLTSCFISHKKRSCSLKNVVEEQDELPSSVGHDFQAHETTIGCTQDILRQRDCLDRLSEIPWLTIDQLIDSSSCGEIDMVIRYLVLEPKIDAMMRDFLE
nr:hypothetical protein [Tanacetum cinerariifolium]